MNQEIRLDVGFLNTRPGADAGCWAPARVKASWSPLKDTNWEAEFAGGLVKDLRTSHEAVGPFLRAASDGLSMPMTILWALEHLNKDDAWTRKNTLTIHVLGAYEAELKNAKVFEEILHRLPDVKKLMLVLCGPELDSLIDMRGRSQELSMDTCRSCATRKRTRVHQLVAQTYHDFGKSFGNKFVKPDLAVAFNSGCSQEAVRPWRETISFLVKNKIPTVFTAYNREEADAEAQLLQAAGAQLVPALGPAKNVWGSMLAKKEPTRVTGFYAVNGWLAGGFS